LFSAVARLRRIIRAELYSLVICTGAGLENTPPETYDAIRNAATAAGRLMSLRI